jgi:hypothetical protein
MSQEYNSEQIKEIIKSVIETKKKIEKSSKDRGYFVEAEIRFGKITSHAFDSIITDSKELNTTENLYEVKNKKNIVLKEVVDNCDGQRHNPKFILKEEVSSDYVVFGSTTKLKVVLSIERVYHDINNKLFLMTRHKSRMSKEMSGFRIDKTKIVDEDKKTSYELELEITDVDVDVVEFVETLRKISDSIYKYANVKRLIASITPDVDLSVYKFPKPVDVSVRDIRYKFKGGGSVGYKLDGFRKFIAIIGGNIYSISISGDETLIYEGRSGNAVLSVYDSEQMGDQYHIFDTIIQSGKNVLGEDLVKRISYIPELCIRINMEIQKQLFVAKSHFIFRDFNGFKEAHKMILNKMDGYVCDGMIYTPMGKYNEVFRLKPRMTVDFAFVDGSLKLFSKGKLVDSDFTLQESEEKLPEESYIIECYIEKPGKAFYIRPRPDKKFPNLYGLVKKSLKFVGEENKISDSFQGKTVYFLRSYHNDVKRRLLEKGSGNLLDIGSGRGGDISKWMSYVKVFCVEPNDENIVELTSRIRSKVLNIRTPKIEVLSSVIENVCENYPIILNENITTISAMFSLNLVDLEKTINVIDKISSDSCLFICTVMSGKYVKRFFKVIGKDSFCCESYTLRLRKNVLSIDVGDTMVRNQVENLLDVDKFVEDMARIRFRLQNRKRMLEEFFMSDDEYVLSSMYEYLIFCKDRDEA